MAGRDTGPMVLNQRESDQAEVVTPEKAGVQKSLLGGTGFLLPQE